MVLKSLQSFGRGDAESDTGLAEYFIETPSYRGIENQRNLVVIGRKGAGKTAIYSILLERARLWNNVYAVGLDFEGYKWGDLHDAACPSGEPTSNHYATLWQFLILVELAKLVLREGDEKSGLEAWKAKRKLKRFIERNWGGVDAKVSEMFMRTSFELTVEPRAMGFALFSLRRRKVARENLGSSLAPVNEWLRASLLTLLDPEASYFALLDELDSGFGSENEAAQKRLIGLLLAAREIRIWARKEKLKLTPVVFMRSDIYAALKFPSKNKISSEDLERIEWSEDSDASASLKALIEQRIGAAFRSDHPWIEVFEESGPDGEPLYKFMAARTHRRPRDMIKLANLSLDEAKAAGAAKIGYEHVVAAMPLYSKYLLGELEDPAHQHVPEWEEHVMTLRRLGTAAFDLESFKIVHEAGASVRSHDKALERLYAFGVIGYVQGAGVIYAHHHDGKLDPAASKFEVHPGLLIELNLASANGRPAAGRGRGVD